MKNVIDVTSKGAMSRRSFIGFASVAAFSAVALSGCSSKESAAPEATLMKIGTMQTEDSLPFWVAEQKGFYGDHDVEVEIVTFQSAQELSTAFAAGEIDGAMTDIMVSASLVASGIGLNLAWVTLGTTPEQGRFGIQTSPESGIKSLADLKGKDIGVGSNTVPEYVMDKLMEAAGASEGEIVNEEIKKLPVRYESMTNNQVAAAALPGSLLALGEATGMITLADDTQGVGNVSQSILAVRSSWLEGGKAALESVRLAWNDAVAAIEADPEGFRDLLVEKANLPGIVADTYPISSYPEAELPTKDMVDPVLDWMKGKEYLQADVAYDSETGDLKAK